MNTAANQYDAIVVGARCAGSPTAMLLARKGLKVLLVDRTTFPSDTMSTHLVHPPGLAALERWGLLERLEATGCPRIETYAFDFGPLAISGHPQPIDGVGWACAPRRTVLDKLLVDAAVEAGVGLREAFTVDGLLHENEAVTGIRGRTAGGAPVQETARIVIGADGRRSLVAKAKKPRQYHERPSRNALYNAYWSGLPVDDFATMLRPEHRRGWATSPTHDGLTVLVFGWPIEEYQANRADIEGHFFETIALIPEFAERVRAATRESRFVGSADLPGYFRKPFGPGWALVGDAGYHKNPITGMGINDAFRDAELLAAAVADAIDGRRPWEQAMHDYQCIRDEEALPMYELTDEIAHLEPPLPELQRLLAAMQGNQEAIDAFHQRQRQHATGAAVLRARKRGADPGWDRGAVVSSDLIQQTSEPGSARAQYCRNGKPRTVVLAPDLRRDGCPGQSDARTAPGTQFLLSLRRVRGRFGSIEGVTPC
jgi:2-polyprenyl-6-methoxyphenol hydroxylase-like FAD-dependent oxidoreductase